MDCHRIEGSLSDSGTHAVNRIPWNWKNMTRVDGTVIVDGGINDLFDGSLDASLIGIIIIFCSGNALTSSLGNGTVVNTYVTCGDYTTSGSVLLWSCWIIYGKLAYTGNTSKVEHQDIIINYIVLRIIHRPLTPRLTPWTFRISFRWRPAQPLPGSNDCWRDECRSHPDTFCFCDGRITQVYSQPEWRWCCGGCEHPFRSRTEIL